MHIVNLYAKEIPACATFKFRGYMISMSTIFKNCTVAVFNTPTGLPVHEALTVEEAINWIINQPER